MGSLATAQVAEKLRFKKNLLLRRIRHGGQRGRLQLARELRLSSSRVCDLIQEMLDEGSLVEQTTRPSRRGRRSVPIRVNASFGNLLGLDFEAKRMRLVLLDFAGTSIWEKYAPLPQPRTREALVDTLLTFIESGRHESRSRGSEVIGIGLAAPGVLDLARGVILHYEPLRVARDVPLRDLVAAHSGLPCLMEDTIRAMTLAEWMSGAARPFRSFICVAVRSGVGAGIMLNGKLLEGSHGHAGEVGYVTLPLGESLDQWRHLHDVVSEVALDVAADNFTLPPDIAARAGQLLGCYLASMAALIDPEAIVLGGGLLQREGPLWHSVTATFRQFALPDNARQVQLVPAQLGPYAAAAGAAHRCFQMLYPTEPNLTPG